MDLQNKNRRFLQQNLITDKVYCNPGGNLWSRWLGRCRVVWQNQESLTENLPGAAQGHSLQTRLCEDQAGRISKTLHGVSSGCGNTHGRTSHGKPIDKVLEENPRLEIVFFPTASPDLNPQKHVWKAARTEVSHNHLEAQLPKLADRLEPTQYEYFHKLIPG